MFPSTLFKRRAKRRTRASDEQRGIALVVALMMTLVFAPVVGLHLAASAFGGPTAGAAASAPASVEVAAGPKTGPG